MLKYISYSEKEKFLLKKGAFLRCCMRADQWDVLPQRSMSLVEEVTFI